MFEKSCFPLCLHSATCSFHGFEWLKLLSIDFSLNLMLSSCLYTDFIGILWAL